MFAAQGLDAAKIEVVWNIHPLALDRFDNECRDVALRQGFFQRGEVVEGDCRESGDKRAEAFPKYSIAIRRQCAIGQAMEGVIAIDNAGTPRCAAREFDRGFDSLGSGV